jgi:hypothetical protein
MMRRSPSLAVLATLLLLVACGGAPPEAGLTAEERAVVGTWEVDVEAFEASFVRMIEKQLAATARAGDFEPEDMDGMRKELHAQLREQFAGMWGQFVFAEDGTFSGDGKDGTTRGAWTLNASRLAMIHTHEKGRKAAQPDAWYGTYRDDTIVLRPEPDKDYELTLVRAKP